MLSQVVGHLLESCEKHPVHGVSRSYHRRRVTDEMRKDINTWLLFSENFNVDGVTLCRLVNWSNDSYFLVIYR